MGFNLRRSKKLFPGIRLNLSKNGLGVSIGPAHTKISLSPKGRMTSNLGVPGTGLRYTKVIKTKKQAKKSSEASISRDSTLDEAKISPELAQNSPLGGDEAEPSKYLSSNLLRASSETEGSVSVNFETVRKYIILDPTGTPTWHPQLLNIDMLKEKIKLGEVTSETQIVDSYTGLTHMAKELLGSYLF